MIEGLNVAGMSRDRRPIADVGMAELHRWPGCRTAWSGHHLVVADRLCPSSKTGDDCGAVKAELPLWQRTFTCPSRIAAWTRPTTSRA